MKHSLYWLKYFAIGRNFPAVIGTLVLAFGACVAWWYVTFPTHLLGQVQARWVPIFELVPVVGGVIAITSLAPRLPRLEAMAAQVPRRVSTFSALTVALAVTLLAPSAYLLLSALPENLIPAHNHYLTEGQEFTDVAPTPALWMLTLNVAVFAGLSLGLVATLGRYVGMGVALLSYLGLILSQSTPAFHWLPLTGHIGQVAEISYTQTVFGVTSLILGTATWHFAPTIRSTSLCRS